MKVLLIGSLAGNHGSLAMALSHLGLHLQQVENNDAALSVLRSDALFDLVIYDDDAHDFPAFARALQAANRVIPLLTCGSDTDPSATARAAAAGARAFLPLPVGCDQKKAFLEAAIAQRPALVTQDASMVGVVRSAEHMALSGAPVLIFGEPGTGRATLARHIHWRSRHFGQPFVSVNCRSFPRNFLEQNFLGTGKSIFSGLLAQCTGRAEAIEGAVLLLNDVDQLDISAQTLILQGMREQEEEDAPRRAKIRIFATSSGELRDAVSRLTFLSDLYFRLNVLSLSMPRLRDRRDDIAPLSKYFAHRHAATYRCPNYRVSHAAIGKLTTYPWFGNVLELNNVMHRAVLHAKGPEIDSDDIDLDFSTCALPRNMANDHDPDRAFIPRRLEDIERSAIIDTLGHTRGNRRDAANILGMPIRTMHTRIHGYMSLGLRVPPPTPRIAA